MNCLLMREISVQNTIRMWDTYLVCLVQSLARHGITYQNAGGRPGCVFAISSLRMLCVFGKVERETTANGFSGWLCCLLYTSEVHIGYSLQGIIMFLQSLPTQDWGDHEIEMLLSEAFVLNSIWHNAQSHFNGK
jgi:TBC1 domain family member 2